MKITIFGFESCPYFQAAKSRALKLDGKVPNLEIDIVAKLPDDYRAWIRKNALAIEVGHTSSPACFVGDYSVLKPTSDDYLIGGNDKFQVFARKLEHKSGPCLLS